MSKHCLNCGHPVKEKYCPNCGQQTDVARVTWKGFVAEFVHTITHAERSIFGTSWQLLKNPGRVLNEYIAGKRKKYQPPVGFFLIWVTASVLCHRAVISHIGFNPVYMPGLTFSNPESIRAFVVYGQWFYITAFPLSAAIFYFILARPLYSYMESLVITMYAFSVVYMLFVLCYVIGGFALSLNVLHWKFYLFQIILSLTYTIYACISLFRHHPVKHFWLRLLLYMIVNAVVILKFLELLSNLWVMTEGQLKG